MLKNHLNEKLKLMVEFLGICFILLTISVSFDPSGSVLLTIVIVVCSVLFCEMHLSPPNEILSICSLVCLLLNLVCF